MRTATLLLVLVVAAHDVAAAQLDPRVRMGARVRVNSADVQVIGRVAEVRDDTIVVDRGQGDIAVVALRDATGLAVYARGKGAEAFATTLGVIGAVSGATLYIRWCMRDPEGCQALEEMQDDDDDDFEDEDDDEGPFSSVFATVTIGFGAIGMLIGHALAPPEWQIVNLPVRMGLAPTQDGVAAYVSLPAPRFARLFR